MPDSLSNVACKTPNGQRALLGLNGSKTPQTFNIGYNNRQATPTLGSGAVGTYVW